MLFEDNFFQFKLVFCGFYIILVIQLVDIKLFFNDWVMWKFLLMGGGMLFVWVVFNYGYFFKELFMNVIFFDCNLVCQYISKIKFQLCQFVVFGVLCMFGLVFGGWSWFYFNNCSLFENVVQDVVKVVWVQEGWIDFQLCFEVFEILQDCLGQFECFNEDYLILIGLGFYQGEQMVDWLCYEYLVGVSNVMLVLVWENFEVFLNEVNVYGDCLKLQIEVVGN